MYKKRKLILIIIMLLLSCFVKGEALEKDNGLVCENSRCYYYESGIKKVGFKEINGKTYFFSRINDNAMKYGWQYIDGYYYYFNNEGVMLTGLQQINNKYYYFDEDGKRAQAFRKVDEKTYFFSRINDNAMKYGWQYIDGYYYYFDEEGIMLTGNQTIENNSDEFDNTGKLKKGIVKYNGRTYFYNNYKKQVGFQEVDGKTYFFSRINDNAIKLNWQAIDGYYYYFDSDKGMLTGLQQINNKYYYFDEDGKRATAFREVDGKTYFFSRINDNAMKYGWQYIDGYYYYFNNEGVMLTGLQQIDNKYYYFDEDGKRATAFREVDGKTYFFSRINDNAMKYGWQYIDGYYYYFNEEGIMLTGNQTIENNSDEFDNTGKLKKGIVKYNGRTYFYNNYVKQVGFQEVDGKIYFFSRINDNAIKLNWQAIDGYYYYFDSDKGMLTGLQQINNKYYYFDEDGKRLQGFQKVDGKTYFFSRINDNAMKHGWQNIDGYFYYFNEDGTMNIDNLDKDGLTYTFTQNGKVKLTGWNTINGIRYFFNNSYMVISNSSKLVIDISHHQGEINWEQLYRSGQIYGVIIRLGYLDYGCKLFVDKRLKEYTDAVKKYNIPYGVYWFSYADNASEALYEANYTKQLISSYNLNPTLGIYYDLEYNIPNPSPITYQQITKTYIDNVKSTYGNYNVKVYASTYFALNTIGFKDQEANRYIGWIAQWSDTNTYPYSFDIWQYSSKGSIPGISTNVDLNYYFR